MTSELTIEIAATAARLVVEEGLEYGPAKARALKVLGLPPRTALPSNDELEDQVREYLDIFCAETQPAELQALRELAAVWMERLAEFRPHLTGAVWRGTATRVGIPPASPSSFTKFSPLSKRAATLTVSRSMTMLTGSRSCPSSNNSVLSKRPSLFSTSR